MRPAALALFGFMVGALPGAVKAELPVQFLASFPQNMYPAGQPAKGRDGNLYGATFEGGDFNGGTVYRLSTAGAFRVLYSFPGLNGGYGQYPIPNATGSYPIGNVLVLEDGGLVGVCGYGGAYGYGTVFKVSLDGHLTVLHDFSWPHGDFSGLILTQEGEVWGYTYGAPSTIYRISPDGTFTVMYTFNQAINGVTVNLDWPSSLVQGADGNIYGTTLNGGNQYDPLLVKYKSGGTLFRIDGENQLTVLRQFDANYFAPNYLIPAPDGSFYGTVTSSSNTGAIFQISVDGDFAIVHQFDAPILLHPVLGGDGLLYGETEYYGGNASGIIYSVSLDGSDILTSLYSYDPQYCQMARTGLTDGGDGYLYEATDAWILYLPKSNGSSAVSAAEATRSDVVRSTQSSPAAHPHGRVFRVKVSDLGVVNHPPTVPNLELRSGRFGSGKTHPLSATFPALAGARDADRDRLAVASFTNPAHGNVSLDQARQLMTYQPAQGVLWNDSFSYTITDGRGGFATALVTIDQNTAGKYSATFPQGGNVDLKVTNSRVLSGNVVFNGKSKHFSGRFNAANRFRKSFQARDRSIFAVELTLVPTDTAWQILATVSDGSDSASGTCIVAN